MLTAKWILDAYEEGNDTVRWELYMAYRDLRPFFDEMEASQRVQPRQKKKSTAEKLSRIRWNFNARMAKGFGS